MAVRLPLVLMHRYVGLTIAGFLFVAGLTGAVLAFHREIDAALNPQLYDAPSSRGLAPLGALKIRVESQLPGARVTAIQPPWRPGESVRMEVEPSRPEIDLAYDEVFVDPLNAQVLGRRSWGACCLGRKNLVPFLYKLHYSLHLPGRWGLWLMGSVAGLWAIDCLVALTITAPRGNRRAKGWRRALSVKANAGPARRTLDLHRAPGLWLWPVLLVVAVTGMGLNLRDQVFEPIVSVFSPVSPTLFEQAVPKVEGGERLSYDSAVAIASRMAESAGRPGAVAYVMHSPDLKAFGVALSRRGGRDPRGGLGPDWYYLDSRDGALRGVDFAGRGSAGDVVIQARLPLHTGLVFGLFGRIIVCLAGVVTAALSVTGVPIWAKKRKAKRRRDAPAAALVQVSKTGVAS